MSQGDRFRRKALRRGYKVDEVDDFLERAEATLAGEPVNPPMTAEDIRDVVFRTRFGGYDEWQVDLHLDRLERELEDYATGAAPRGSNGFPSREDNGVTTQIPRIPAMQAEPPPVPVANPMMPPHMMPPPVPVPPMGMMPPPMQQQPMQQQPMQQQRAMRPQQQPMQPQYGDAFSDSLPPPMPIGYDAYAGRHGKADMTVELPAMGGYISPFTNEDKARVAELRAGFKPRRFGSGYDAGQVERLFEAVVAMMNGRGSARVSDSDLDPAQFPLVQGGYFEDEVESALVEVRALFSRRLG